MSENTDAVWCQRAQCCQDCLYFNGFKFGYDGICDLNLELQIRRCIDWCDEFKPKAGERE